MGNILITKHAQDRIKERCGFNRKAAQRMADKVYQEGIRISSTKGEVGDWALSRHINHPDSEIAIYGDKAWVYAPHHMEDTTALVTVIQIPTPLQKKVNVLLNKI